MSGHVLERRQVVPGDLGSVFAFFEDPSNLEAITPAWLRFEVVAATDTRMRLDTEIEYRLRWQHVPMVWRSRIAEYQKNERFSDEMLRGPYRYWYHQHVFTEVPGGVEMLDTVDYQLPYGPLGQLVHSALVRRQLETIFDYRRSAIERIFARPASVDGVISGRE